MFIVTIADMKVCGWYEGIRKGDKYDMKGKITNRGRLYILRGDRHKPQLCHVSSGLNTTCGDDCSLFGEPSIKEYGKDGVFTVLGLCHGTILYFDEFEDERDHTREEPLKHRNSEEYYKAELYGELQGKGIS